MRVWSASPVSRRNVIAISVLLLAAAWWFLHEDPEAEVRDAHQELTRLLSKSKNETAGTMLVDALVKFTAVLVGRSTMTGGEEAAETREVVSRLRKVEGAWLFSEFRLAKVIEN